MQPEDPVTISQVRTWFKYQASAEEKRAVLTEFGENQRPKVKTQNRRTQADFRPLVRDKATQVEVRPQVTRLPSGGLSVEASNFSFRYDGPVTDTQLQLQE